MATIARQLADRIPRFRRIALRRTTKTTLNISAHHAARALHVLIADGKIAATDVTAALKRREHLIHELRQRLDALEKGVVSAMKATGGKVARKVMRSKRKMSPARLAALRLNGRYMGHVRRLSKAQKAKVKAIREAKGVRAAIAAAKKLAS